MSVAQRAARDPRFRAAALKNPGLRSKLPASMLPAALRAQRNTNTRLAAPVAPGSAMTGRDLAHEAAAAGAVKYGPVEDDLRQQSAQAAQRQRDVGGWYDQYLAQLETGARKIGDIQSNTATSLAALNEGTGAITPGLAGLGPLADQAQQARKNLVGSYQAQQSLTGAAQRGAAETRAHVVAPGQKLAALATEQSKIGDLARKKTDLTREKAAFNTTTRGEIRQREQNYGLAAKSLDIKTDAAKNAASPGAATYEKEFAKQAAKYGRDPHQWATLGPKARQNIINADKTKPSDAVYTSGVFVGKRKADVEAMTDTERQKIIDAAAKTKDKPKTGKGPEWLTPNESGAGQQQLVPLKSWARRIKAGIAIDPNHKGASLPKLDRHAAAAKLAQFTANLKPPVKHPVLVTAALDAAYDGHLSPATVKALIAAGYKPSDVARTLGVKTAGQITPAERRTQKTAQQVAGAIRQAKSKLPGS